MIRRWKVSNFKSIKSGMGYLEFAPITLFAGANSSGKSSVIQSIMVLMQTIAGDVDNTLLLNGELLSLGTASDVWYNGILETRRSPVSLDYAIEIDDPGVDDGRLQFEFSFVPDGSRVLLHRSACFRQFSPDSDPIGLAAEFHRDNYYQLIHVDRDLEREESAAIEDAGFKLNKRIRGSFAEMKGLFPCIVHLSVTRTREDLNWDIALLDPNDPRIMPEHLEYLIDDKYQSVLKKAAKKLGLPAVYEKGQHNREIMLIRTLGDYREWFGNLSGRAVTALQKYYYKELKGLLVTDEIPWRIRFVDTARAYFETFFGQSIRYLSANRIAPTVIFSPDISSQWSEVGINGANVAAALQAYGPLPVTWYDPSELNSRETSLFEAVVTWLRFLGIIEDVFTGDRGKFGTMLTIRVSGVDQDLDLTSVGFGTSQILPIIVQGLLTPPGGVFIVEQPEVHLHPSVQAQLALFFVALTRAGVQCIIETHSEHLVNQLRIFLADRKRSLEGQIKIYFAERDSDGTYFHNIELDRRGNIKNWPKGFMDESIRQAEIMLDAILSEGE